uniref:Major facilitator superfamily (MFS) profile domain-containing protein n=1 Tax=Acrobeloides nanus TaxID=290746 RepID=A0A914CRM4_9BILA
MAHWFSASNRGFILGIWAANASAGNIFGALLVSVVLAFGYEYTFAFNTIFIFIGALVLYLFVDTQPKDEHFYEEIANEPAEDENDIPQRATSGSRPITILEAILLPNVLMYCLCTACLKLVNYAFFFWLPYYLTHKYSWHEADANQLSAWFDFGGIVGSIVGGIISDRLGHRSVVIQIMLLTSLVTLFAYEDISASKLANTAMSTVSGLINGVGSAGAAIGQLLVPLIQSRFGWSNVFYMFIIMNALSIICLAKRFYHDVQDLLKPYFTRSTPVNDEQGPLLLNNEA